MSTSLFTLVHCPQQAARQPDSLEDWQFQLRMEDRALADSLSPLKQPALGRTLLHALFAQPAAAQQAPTRDQLQALRRMVDQVQRSRSQTVGVWDLNSYVARLDQILTTMNEAQQWLVFFDVHAAVPAGLVLPAERVKEWVQSVWHQRKQKPLSAKELHSRLSQVGDAVLMDDFAERADTVRQELGLDYLIGITANTIAAAEELREGEPITDYLLQHQGRVILISSSGVREYAATARKPFELAMANLIVTGILAVDHPEPEWWHNEDVGCLFDLDYDRAGFVRNLRKPHICPEHRRQLGEKQLVAGDQLLAALQGYRRRKP